ncbi:hypothetical protein ACQPXH_27660 [Nocardia sp. CA-135953]|uniref:hypothetical protein n=1 Tax=Nocardia sp. CA-135953 TaxID=3239978 RepID=UPI003D971873
MFAISLDVDGAELRPLEPRHPPGAVDDRVAEPRRHRRGAMLGMTKDGVLREFYPHRGQRFDVEVWSVLAPEWRAGVG